MVTNDQQLRLLLRSRLQVSVVDMHGEEAEDPSEGLLGKINRYERIGINLYRMKKYFVFYIMCCV